MRTNLFKDRVIIQKETTTQTAMGHTSVWSPEMVRFGRVVPIDALARSQFQQIDTEVTHRIIFEGSVILDLASKRFMYGGHTYEPIGPAIERDKNTVIMVKIT